MKTISTADREAYLLLAVDIMRDAVFKPAGIAIPEIRVSVGLPHARNQRDILCQHFPASRTADKVAQLFVSPLLSASAAVLAQLHNCLHKSYGRGADRPPFGAEHIKLILDAIGEYPHAALSLPETVKQDTRMLKMQCKQCGYTARATRKWIAKYGTVYCPCKGSTLNAPQMSCPEFN